MVLYWPAHVGILARWGLVAPELARGACPRRGASGLSTGTSPRAAPFRRGALARTPGRRRAGALRLRHHGEREQGGGEEGGGEEGAAAEALAPTPAHDLGRALLLRPGPALGWAGCAADLHLRSR